MDKQGKGTLFYVGPRFITNQTWRIMKLIIFFLFTGLMQVSGKGYSQNITLNMDGASLEEVLLNINKQTGFSYSVNNTTLQKTKPINIHISNGTIHQVLDLCLKGQQLTYSILNRIIIIKESLPGLQITSKQEDDPINVKGKVTNESGEPVQGASINIKGTSKGTSTDENGEFFLTAVDARAVLVISGTNIETLEINVEGKVDLETLTVRAKVIQGEEVIVNGYSKTPPERFTGAYEKLSKAAFDSRPATPMILRLEGMVNGLLFDKTATGDRILRSIQERGLSTLPITSGSPNPSPLIIVDKFPYKQDISTINPNDVEDITVLKDAAATSIWGAQAGNGVIVITTKKGKYKQAFQVSGKSLVSISEKPDQYYFPRMSVPDFVDAEVFLFNKGAYDGNLGNNISWPVISPVVEVLNRRRLGEISSADSAAQIDAFKAMDIRRDLKKFAYRPAFQQQHYIDISGGNEMFNYGFSAGYNRMLNGTQNSKPDDQITVNVNTGFRPRKNIEIATGINYSQATTRSVDFLENTSLPYVQLADAQGNALAVPYRYRNAYLDTVGSGKLLDWKYKPLEEPGLTDKSFIARVIRFDVSATYNFNNWLTASLSYQYANATENNEQIFSTKTYLARDLINLFTNLTQTDPALRNPVPIGGIFSATHNASITQNVRSQINFQKRFRGNLHQVNGMLVAEISENKGAGGDGTIIYGYNKEINSYNTSIDYNTLFPLFGNFLGGSGRITNGSVIISKTSTRFVSFLGSGSYTYNNRYTIYASARKDGSNLFGVNTNRKWNPLWSTGTSWDLSKENFYKIKWLPLLRLRVSYGYSGNPGTASGLPLISYGQISNLSQLQYASPLMAPNPDLRWEKVSTINAGLDFSLIHDRLTGKIDIWQKKSTDVIAQTPIAPSTGNQLFPTNNASLKGNGFEISLNSVNIRTKDFNWQTNFGLSHAKSIVTKLYFSARTAQDFVNYGINASEGQIAFGIASYKWAGLDPQTGDPRGYLNKQVSTNYFAIANDSIGEQVFHGSSIPLYHGFINNSVTFQNFTLFVNITYRLNFYFRKPTINYEAFVRGGQSNPDYSLRWQKSGDEVYTTVPSFIYPFPTTVGSRDLFYQYSEVNVLRGDNIRIQGISLSYNWDFTNYKRKLFKRLQLFANASNLNIILWRKSKSKLDPDFITGNVFVPPSKAWSGGINIGF